MSNKPGTWCVSSETNPEWDCEGRTYSCGNFSIPEECQEAIKNKEQKLGDQPEDLIYGYMKD